jgi:hypothetical protein
LAQPRRASVRSKDGERAARTNGRIPTCQGDNADSEVAPAVREGSADCDFLDFACRFDAALGQETAKPALEGGAASHWRMTSDKEDNVFGHETQDSVDVTCSRCAVPKRDHIANGLLVRAHGHKILE